MNVYLKTHVLSAETLKESKIYSSYIYLQRWGSYANIQNYRPISTYYNI